MTTALLLIIPVVVMLVLRVIAKIAIGRAVVDREPISSAWPTVPDALPSAEAEHEDVRPVGKAA